MYKYFIQIYFLQWHKASSNAIGYVVSKKKSYLIVKILLILFFYGLQVKYK